ncbi:(2Fe-2S)-binding protein [Salinarchaeum sp. IM2453]|uniref:2Fe-2S iron-sulfur cluster-binding protein n=1 Tax=Salinarchaeum sp. IM2453 TaxID=2862870 RepID=UPI001C833B72|nr:2Fe-2S iron-sulfur cluster-binding protein [Salinarchaeum sp. IM2453]QZA88303.1 (2Fe-2S)-binding protein [Salinarchaeum sp. IM2453]
MPVITYQGEQIECESGDTLREVLINHDKSPHKGITKKINCGGNATCGTCAVRIVEGPVGEPAGREKTRLRLSTHDDVESVRLACQYSVSDDLTIEKP